MTENERIELANLLFRGFPINKENLYEYTSIK